MRCASELEINKQIKLGKRAGLQFCELELLNNSTFSNDFIIVLRKIMTDNENNFNKIKHLNHLNLELEIQIEFEIFFRDSRYKLPDFFEKYEGNLNNNQIRECRLAIKNGFSMDQLNPIMNPILSASKMRDLRWRLMFQKNTVRRNDGLFNTLDVVVLVSSDLKLSNFEMDAYPIGSVVEVVEPHFCKVLLCSSDGKIEASPTKVETKLLRYATDDEVDALLKLRDSRLRY